ncbi:MAG: hypothetical protein ROO76_15070 [Terriglobia bacterium]|nr:hypothetical protein [Terriglobia bacterium]
MSKLRIEHGASKINWVLLKTNIEGSISHDIDLMCQWSENDRKYVVNELLRFGLTQSEEFQKYKAANDAKIAPLTKDAKPAPVATKVTTDPTSKLAVPVPGTAIRQ